MAPPTSLRIGHLTYTVAVDDAAVHEHAVREQGDYAGFSQSATQRIIPATRDTGSGVDHGPDYRAETLLHEVLHQCLAVAGCLPDKDAKAGVDDVEERAVVAMAGPLLAVLRDNPRLVEYLVRR